MITDLEQIVSGMQPEDCRRFDRMYLWVTSEAEVVFPERMKQWVVNQFKYLTQKGNQTPEGRAEILAKMQRQKIVHIMNRCTSQATLFNHVRASRPLATEAKTPADLEREIKADAEPCKHCWESKCDFCVPLHFTCANKFGRIRDKTAANVAPYDGYHGLVVFQDHNPLRFRGDKFTVEEVADLLATSREWAEKCHAEDREARYFFLMWNCLWKAGASIIHGHAQMTVGRKFHYGKVERLRRDALAYRQAHRANYFDDLVRVHDALGLAARWGGVTALAHLTPVKEKELVLVADRFDSPDLAPAMHRALKAYARLGVESYNMAVYMPPLGPADPAWEGFPVLVHFVDRGSPGAKTADVGAMELYTSSVVSSDPFDVAAALRRTGK